MTGGLKFVGHGVEIVAAPERNVERHAGRAEGLLDLVQQRREVDVVRVHLVDDEDPAEPLLAGFVEHAAGVHFDARMGVDDDGRGVDAAQGFDGLADEVGIARRVDDVKVFAGVIEMGDFGFDRVFVCLFFFVEVADAGAVVDAGRMVDGPGLDQQGVDERRLAGRTVTTKGNVADVLDSLQTHERGVLSR